MRVLCLSMLAPKQRNKRAAYNELSLRIQSGDMGVAMSLWNTRLEASNTRV